MRLFTTISLGLALALGCVLPAYANVALVQQAGPSGSPITFGSAPANGTEVSIVTSATVSLVGVTIKDSNGVSLTQELLATDGATVWVALYDYPVSGTPGTGYVVSIGGTSSFGYNLSGVTGALYAMNSSITVGATLVSTIAGVANGDFQDTSFRLATTGSGASALFSNGTTVSDIANLTIAVAHGFATATASSTSTITTGHVANPGAMVYGDYTGTFIPPSSGGTPVKPGNVYPGGSQFPPYTNSYIPQPNWSALCS